MTPMGEYRILLNAVDGAGPYYVTLRVAARGPDEAEEHARRWTAEDGARLLAVEEIEFKQLAPGAASGVLSRTGRGYYAED